MRNFSMKKFGTPIGAGPGTATESVGLVGVGTPCAVRSLAARSFAFLTLSSTSVLVLPSAWGLGIVASCVDCCCCWPPEGLAAVGAVGVDWPVDAGGAV